MQIIVSRYSQVKLMPERVARPRKHPLALTLLSEHYKQLLQEFQDFRGSQFPADSSGSEASDVAHADEVSTTSTPAKQLYVDDNAADGKGQSISSLLLVRTLTSDHSCCLSCGDLKPAQ